MDAVRLGFEILVCYCVRHFAWLEPNGYASAKRTAENAQHFSAGTKRDKDSKARETGDRYRSARSSERVKDSSCVFGPACYRKRFCINSVVRFADLLMKK